MSKSIYTVTTPASYVYFEQTVTPSSSGRSKFKETSRRRNTVYKNDTRFKQIPKTNNIGVTDVNSIDRKFETKKRQKAVLKKVEMNHFETNKGGSFGRLAINANDDHYYPNQDNYFPGTGGGSYRPPNVGVGAVSTSYLPSTGGENAYYILCHYI